MQTFHLFICASILLSALAMILTPGSIIPIIFLILVFCLSGCLLISINCDFLGLVLIIVYVGAIAVLFLFVIMMVETKTQPSFSLLQAYETKDPLTLFVTAVLIAVIVGLLVVAYPYYYTSVGLNDTNTIMLSFFKEFKELPALTLSAFGVILYNYNSIFVILIGLYLLLALIGAVIISLSKSKIKTPV